MYSRLPSKLVELLGVLDPVIEQQIAPRASAVDAECIWPEHSLRALADAGLMGLLVPESLGGLGQGLLALSVVTERIGQACPSSALCYGMHLVASAVIAAKPTPYQQEQYLRPIAQGRHITSLALSEKGTGAHFYYFPETQLNPDGEDFILEGNKAFITNGGHADSYVISAAAPNEDDGEVSELSCVILDADSPGIQWNQPWRGFGMRGNSSRNVHFNQVRIPRQNLLGREGDQLWYIFEVITPYFLMAMAGTYLGIAQAALEAASQHLRNRRYTTFNRTLAQNESLQNRFADLWIAVEKNRALVRQAGALGDLDRTKALPYIFASKLDAGETAVMVTNEAMTLCGGSAYRENSRVAQLLRDARASHVMSPTSDILRQWTGKLLLGLPLL